MKKLSDLLPVPTKSASAPNSERAEQIVEIMSFMGESEHDSKRFKYWLGRTRKISPDELYRLRRQAQGGKNPHALFNFLIKNYAKK